MVLACRALENVLAPHVGADVRVIYKEYGLHVRPDTMAPALQAELDALPEPSTVLIGYGLCGGGLAGLRAGVHELIIPRTDDCIAILLGSRAAYRAAFDEHPGTYYLTKGWLESGSHPLAEHAAFVQLYGEARAGRLMDMMYRNYTRLCFIAGEPADLERYGPLAREVAAFCEARWGMAYEERVGSDALVARLMAAPGRRDGLAKDLLIVPPGGTVRAEMFEVR